MRQLFVAVLWSGCAQPTAIGGAGFGEPSWTPVLGAADDVTDPRDLGFDAEDRMWVANREDDRTFIVTDPGGPDQDVVRRKDGYALHFMEEAAALAFDDGAQFGSCGESRNTYDHSDKANDFTGPALWSTDLRTFAREDPIGLGSHLDMLPESPLCVGIAWDHDNVYWVFDGKNRDIVRYDFQKDHGPGMDDHADGIVRRVVGLDVKRVAGAPGHMVVDHDTGLLYVADTGNGRILRLDTTSGSRGKDLRSTMEPLAEYNQWKGVDWSVLIENLNAPGGLALSDGILYIAEWGSGVIRAIDLEGNEIRSIDSGKGAEAIHGIEVGPDGRLWVTDTATPGVWRLDVPGREP